jgi:LmbE family N-acetylglucosaminyl deacetylase
MRSASLPRTDWTAVLARARPWRPVATRALVVVPHPDDEAVMFGGLIARAVRCGTAVDLLAVTDGDAAYPERMDAESLAAVRRREQDAAAHELGLAPSVISRLGMPDGGVADHEEELATAIATHLEAADVDLVVAPWEHDHHTDHEACGRAARRAAETSRRSITVASGLFWALLREDPPPGIVVRAVELSGRELLRKRSAIGCHVSQVTSLLAEHPVLSSSELAVTRWRREHYLVTP